MVGLRSIEGLVGVATEDGPDLDSVAFFEMSSASAEQVTQQIRSMVERAWEYIAIAYQGRAHLALGYESWDEYVDDRLGDLRLTVPREQRGAVVQSLSNAQMSLRAIAKVLGVSVATAYRDTADGSAEQGQSQADPSTVQGRDGRQYRRRKKSNSACRSAARCMRNRLISVLGTCSRKGAVRGRVGTKDDPHRMCPAPIRRIRRVCRLREWGTVSSRRLRRSSTL